MAKSKTSTHTPPSAVAHQAARGLELRDKFGRGGTAVGVSRAEGLKARKPIDTSEVRKIRAYFARHNVDKRGKNWGDAEKPSAGYIAWLLWGGDAGREWAEAEMSKAEKAA